MKETLNFFTNLYKVNKKLFLVGIIVLAAFVLIGCSSNAGYAGGAPSSPYVGGGCG